MKINQIGVTLSVASALLAIISATVMFSDGSLSVEWAIAALFVFGVSVITALGFAGKSYEREPEMY